MAARSLEPAKRCARPQSRSWRSTGFLGPSISPRVSLTAWSRAAGVMSKDLSDRVRIRDERVLSDERYKLSVFDFDYRRSDGSWQRQSREAFDRKHAAAVLPTDTARGTVILIRQYRLPAFLTGYRAPLVEGIAGALGDDAPHA